MYFYKQQGKQHVDFRGDLILSHNDQTIKARIKSAAPVAARNIKHISNIPNIGFRKRVKATFACIRFIWGENQALTNENINDEGL